MTEETRQTLILWAETYNDPQYFQEDPIAFPTLFAQRFKAGKRSLADVEIAAVFAAHFAWGRRAMIIRDCGRLFEEAGICSRLKSAYEASPSLESLSQDEFRTNIFGQKSDLKAPNKKINMMRRWMVRNDGKVDLGIWKDTDPAYLLIPLDVHVYDEAIALGLTTRKQKDITTVREITDCFADIFPGDPCKGDFSLFGYGVTHPKPTKTK